MGNPQGEIVAIRGGYFPLWRRATSSSLRLRRWLLHLDRPEPLVACRFAPHGYDVHMLPSAPYFTITPTSGQFAKEGAWEHAWSFASHTLPDNAALSGYLGTATEVAFEAFFGEAFFGARLSGPPPAIRAFADQCLQAMCAAAQGESFMAALGQRLPFGPIREKISFAEVGAVNAWRSVGAFRIPDPHLALSDFESLWAALESSPVGQDTQHRKAIEFAFDHPLAHWFGIPVSTQETPHQISRVLLRDALGLMACIHPA